MEFQDFSSKISKIKSILEAKNYTGKTFQYLMVPKERLDFDLNSIQNPKTAAVLALFYPKKNKTHLLLTLRANYKGTHSGQISFPGGKKNNSDKDTIYTALRETKEEVGIDPKEVKNILSLSKLYIPPSNFWVFPFMGILNKKPNFKKNYEVAELIEVCLDDLLNDVNIIHKNRATSYAKNINTPCFLLNNQIVWGATAMILSEIKELIKLT